MRLANGIIIDKEKTFGVLKFSALRREVHIQVITPMWLPLLSCLDSLLLVLLLQPIRNAVP